MSVSRKITFTATCTAVAVFCIGISRFFPLLSITPLVITAFCFYLSMRSGLVYGFLSIAAALVVAFLVGGGINTTFILTGVLFAPYSVLAHFLKRTGYKNLLHAIIRLVSVSALFNVILVIFVFILSKFMVSEIILGYNMEGLTDFFNGVTGYILLALIGTAAAVITDILFVMVSGELEKRIKFLKSYKIVIDNSKTGNSEVNKPKIDKPKTQIDVFADYQKTDDYNIDKSGTDKCKTEGEDNK